MSASIHTPERTLAGLTDFVLEILAVVAIDFDPKHEHPASVRAILATIVAVLGSVLANAVLVGIGTAVFPSTRGFVHFQFSDYGTFTVIGVVVACISWPLVSRVSSVPRWVLLRLVILATPVLWLPDLWILLHGEPIRAVGVLMLMHLTIAFITYQALVHLAPIRPRPDAVVGGSFPLLV